MQEIVGVARRERPCLVDHEEPAGRDLHLVTGHGHEGSRACRVPVHMGNNPRRMVPYGRFNGPRREHLAARGIDPQVDGRRIKSVQFFDELLGGNAAPIVVAHNHVVQVQGGFPGLLSFWDACRRPVPGVVA